MNLISINFQGNNLEVIEETQSVVVKDICESIGIDFKTQHTKLKSDPTFQSKLIKVRTAGGVQEVFTIPISKLNGWLFSISPNKVKAEVREKLIEYKNECFEVLNNYFNQGIAVNEKYHQGKNINYIINGYKSQIIQHRNKIENLENKLKALPKPNFLKDDKFNSHLDYLLYETEAQIDKDPNSREFFQARAGYFANYVKALRAGGDDLQRFAIDEIDKAQKRRNKAEDENSYLKMFAQRVKGRLEELERLKII